jgi:AbrB family looped-hinge helix DNA binding protein
MLTTTMSTKGQVIIPSTIRHAHDWHSGLKFSIVDEGNQLILKPLSQEPSLNIADVAGCIQYQGPKVSIDKISKAPYALAGKEK